MIAYICFANSLGDNYKSDLSNRVTGLSLMVAMLAVIYFMIQMDKKEYRKQFEKTTDYVIKYCESTLNNSTELSSLDGVIKDKLIDCGVLYEQLDTLRETNDDGEFGLF